jgi:4-hydroxybenzoate polyprenyltransferase
VLVAMVGMRTFGMAANRLIDAEIDYRNPRTTTRAIPAGTISRKAMIGYMAVAGLVFIGATSQLNSATWVLAPIPLAVMIGYPYLKRFTWLAHFGMGAVYLIVPPAVSLALTGTMPFGFVVIGIGSMAWVAGFDVLYATADFKVDREQGLHSIPARFGIPASLVISRLLHATAVLLLAVGGVILEASALYSFGVLAAAVLLAYEQSLVRSENLSKLNMAFFTMNGVIAVVFGTFVVIGEVI